MRLAKKPVVTLEAMRLHARQRQIEIRARLDEFARVRERADDEELLAELVFCIFTAGASAKMGLRSIEVVRPLLKSAAHEELANALTGVHRYPRARSGYIITTREFLENDCGLCLHQRLEAFADNTDARRDWLARTRGIKGLGYKEASHFLRNIGYRGYAILDKHILKSLYELKVIDSPAPPATRTKYLAVEERMQSYASDVNLDFDELDLVLWSMKTGEVLK
ncbi:MAG: N-glycosylase/DNA lyase [Pyrinomonadaceae bacterium MAG19_C2-C3]|nr:N-glycosylase/DNA lyase [Pyrinomonadaceae bacterium MAG19_C2-C3]